MKNIKLIQQMEYMTMFIMDVVDDLENLDHRDFENLEYLLIKLRRLKNMGKQYQNKKVWDSDDNCWIEVCYRVPGELSEIDKFEPDLLDAFNSCARDLVNNINFMARIHRNLFNGEKVKKLFELYKYTNE